MINAIDRFVWAVYQKVVDLSQKKPQWWACWASEVLIPAALLRNWESNSGWVYAVVFVLDAYILQMLWRTTHNNTHWDTLQKMSQMDRRLSRLRKGFLVVFVLLETIAFQPLGFLAGFLMLSVYYFALCSDPKPREPKAVPDAA